MTCIVFVFVIVLVTENILKLFHKNILKALSIATM